MSKDTMQAVIFDGPLKVSIQQRPIPKIKEPGDIIVKVRYTALCGSELHVFRGHQPSPTGFIMGHEFTGEVTEVGEGVKKFQKGDKIVTPFTISCGECFYCTHNASARCEKCLLYGTAGLDGGQSEYARIPLADATVVKAPPQIDEKKLVLMADIFPTGYFAAYNAFKGKEHAEIWDEVAVLVGCGPVAMCALVNILEYSPKHLIAVDSIPERLEQARKLGAEPWNFKTDLEGLQKRVKELTNGRGADVVIECVGHSDALEMGFNLLRPFGRISSIGVHNGPIPWTGNQSYGKNLTIQMGRCPVRSLFEKALKQLEKNQHKLDFMIDNIRPLSDAVVAYDEFNNMKYHKIVFEADK